MLMSDGDIRAARHMGWLNIDPFDPEMLQPASIDIRLGNTFVRYTDNGGVYDGKLVTIDPEENNAHLHTTMVIPDGGTLLLHPNGFMLAHTVETITLGDRTAARLEGRSSYARLGLIIHSTAGFIDPGFTGQITLELSNLAPHPILLRPGARVGQLSFIPLVSSASAPYGTRDGSKYQGQKGATVSRAHQDKW